MKDPLSILSMIELSVKFSVREELLSFFLNLLKLEPFLVKLLLMLLKRSESLLERTLSSLTLPYF